MGNAPTILLAEDEADIRTLVAEALAEAGFNVLPASDGEEAISLIKLQSNIDLVVTDVNMPKATGFEVAEKARAQRPDIPILLMSAGANEINSYSVPEPRSYLSKPFMLRVMVSSVRDLIKRTL